MKGKRNKGTVTFFKVSSVFELKKIDNFFFKLLCI